MSQNLFAKLRILLHNTSAITGINKKDSLVSGEIHEIWEERKARLLIISKVFTKQNQVKNKNILKKYVFADVTNNHWS